MTAELAMDILARLQDAAPVDLDRMLDAPGAATQGATLVTADPIALSPALWSHAEGWACLGIRVTTPLPDVTSLARRLAATALERGIFPVILTPLDQSGFERFGFRVERLTEAGAAGEEAELAGFWNFALILDAGDLMLMG